MRQLIERHGGLFLTQSNSASIDELVREIDGRRSHEAQAQSQTALTDVPGWWTLAVGDSACGLVGYGVEVEAMSTFGFAPASAGLAAPLWLR